MVKRQVLFDPIKLRRLDSPRGRVYETPEGNRYPSITTVLSADEKEYLKEWRMSMGIEKADRETQRCADRGTAVHAMLESSLSNHEKVTDGHKLEHVQLFNSLRLWMKKIDNVVALEQPLYSDLLQIAGTVDCIAEYDGMLSIVDFKTSTRPKTEEMIYDYFLQTTAYALMMQQTYGIDIKQVVVMIAVENGMPLVFKKPIDQYIDDTVRRICTYHMKRKQ